VTADTQARETPRFEVRRCGFDWGVFDNQQGRWARNYIGPTSQQDATRGLPQIRQRADAEQKRATRTPGRGSR
jgi:hypothetical protein